MRNLCRQDGILLRPSMAKLSPSMALGEGGTPDPATALFTALASHTGQPPVHYLVTLLVLPLPTTMSLECLIGLKFDNFVLVATDMSHLQSIMVQKSDDDKMYQLSSTLVMAVSGEAGDTTQFAEYIAKNIQLYKMRNGYELSPSAAVHFIRHTLATRLRSREPYFVNSLIGGYDPDTSKTELYYMDYLATSVPVQYYAFGYGGMFTISIMDKEYRSDMSQEQGYELLKKCISEIKKRFIVNLPKFRVRMISKDGIKDLENITAVGEAA